MTLGVVLLGAGASVRMGRSKLLLPWGNTTVIGHLLGQWLSLKPAQIAVVCSPHDLPLHAELDRLHLPAIARIFNPQPERGMFSSIQSAALWNGWNQSIGHWAVSLGDQPQVRTQTLRDLLDFASARPREVCQPSHRGRGRHPVILPEEIFRQLPGSDALNLKGFIASSKAGVARCELADEGLDLDLDEPGDYERALLLAGSR